MNYRPFESVNLIVNHPQFFAVQYSWHPSDATHALASPRTALDDKAAGRLLPSGGDFQPSRNEGVDGLLDRRVALNSLRGLRVPALI